jgi:hypothetical protein
MGGTNSMNPNLGPPNDEESKLRKNGPERGSPCPMIAETGGKNEKGILSEIRTPHLAPVQTKN